MSMTMNSDPDWDGAPTVRAVLSGKAPFAPNSDRHARKSVMGRLTRLLPKSPQAAHALRVLSSVFGRDRLFREPGFDAGTARVRAAADEHGPSIRILLPSGQTFEITSYDHNEWPTYCVSYPTPRGTLCTEELRDFMLVDATREGSRLVKELLAAPDVTREEATPAPGPHMTISKAWSSFEAHPLHAAMLRRYGEPWRTYHVWRHVLAIVAHMVRAEEAGVPIEDPEACIAFAVWHDCVYDPTSPHGRNETLSSRLCLSEATEVFPEVSARRATAAILATIGHLPVPHDECPDVALMLDADLAILGAPKAVYDGFDGDIRTEYAHVDESAFREGRAGVLRGFLKRERLYLTSWGHAQWETRARRNLRRAIIRLDNGGSPPKAVDKTL